ncbi:MAG TPA: tRNA (guanosine(46)-N7)-methyltransferase TrmB [Verrucomicrobiae bacterium]|nr:tRNA (guanosine(46)-N7)-methyltransferase TrmB [Verrucomicrobiae bacterium]
MIHSLASITEPLSLEHFFVRPQPIEVELGSGDGSFLVRYAGRHPDRNVLGVERLLGRLRKIDRKALRASLANLRLLRIEASYFLQYLLPGESVAALHVYFPDPWPKRKHRKNRLINAGFPDLVRRALAPGGTVYLRTDDADYFLQMNTSFEEHSGFRPVGTPVELGELLTDFETDFQARGIKTLRAAYQRT